MTVFPTTILFIAFAFVCSASCAHHGKPKMGNLLQTSTSSVSSSLKHHPRQVITPKLRIALIAPLYYPVPAIKYGPIERIIFYLAEQLAFQGHQVTLFASSDSKVPTGGKLIRANWPALFSIPPDEKERPDTSVINNWLFDEVATRAHDFDILHFHTDFSFPKVQQIMRENRRAKVLVTVHNLFSKYPELCHGCNDISVVTLSKDQQTHLAELPVGQKCEPNFIGHVYYGLPANLYTFVSKPAPEDGKPYLFFLGRIHPNKMPHWAIEIAIAARIPLKIAAKKETIFGNKDDYWRESIGPLVNKHHNFVQFIGEIDDAQKNKYLGNALALLFPIDWPEPFGLVMLEAIACGTPVVTRKGYGSVPEVITEHLTGEFFSQLDDVNDSVEAVKRAIALDRSKVRAEFERRFLVERMGKDYEAIYYKGLLLS